jgi:hypothetical protein
MKQQTSLGNRRKCKFGALQMLLLVKGYFSASKFNARNEGVSKIINILQDG